MAADAGALLGHYRLVEKIGEGAMGVVWRAQDTTLDRAVAIKILPSEFAADTERLLRFEREAKTLASLNHPNIAAIYGFHEANGLRFLAMELVGGEDLSQRIGGRGLPFDEALDAARQIAAGLSAAHEGGVVHRDLKPANVKITADGAIKILDFGLAKTSGPVAVSGPGGSGGSMTMTSAGTAAGVILGTAAYMSPEQARGKPVDRRTDVWAFGCLLYEMLTGRAAFDGETVTDVLAAIVHKEPDWRALPSASRPRVEQLIRRCLAKDARERVRDLADLSLELRDLESDAPASAAPRSRSWLSLAAVGIAGVLLGAWVALKSPARPTAKGTGHAGGAKVTSMIQLTDLPDVEYAPNMSPDGKSFLYVAYDGGDEDVFLQRVGGENAVNLTAASPEDDFDPAFSPDGERIAFVSRREGGGVFVMGATGESPKKIATEGNHPAWSPDGGRIVFSTERVLDPFSRATIASLFVVDVATGDRTKIHDGDAVQPSWSPSGKRIAFWSSEKGQRDVRTIPAGGGPAVAITSDAATDWDPFWSPDGRSLYFFSDRRGGPDLWRVPIDESSGAAGGEPEAVTTGTSRPMQASISGDGHRIALVIDAARGEILRVPFDPVAGRVTAPPVSLFSSASPFAQLDVSDDGQWIAYRTSKPRENVFVIKSDGTERRRLTDDTFRNRGPNWVNNDEWILFYSNRTGDYQLHLVRRDGTGLKAIKLADRAVTTPVVSRDGARVAMAVQPKTGPIQFGIARIDSAWFGAGDAVLDLQIDAGVTSFAPLAWSPDGTRIAGLTNDPRGTMRAIYTLSTHSVETFGSFTPSMTWLPDNRRLLLWDGRRNATFLVDSVTHGVQEAPGIPGSSRFALSGDGRTLVLNRQVEERDIWMLTLE